MAQYEQWSFPWPSGGVGDGLDNALTDELFKFFVQSLFTDEDGTHCVMPYSNRPFSSVAEPLLVRAQTPNTTKVEVTPGIGAVLGRWMYNSVITEFTISANASGNPRIDTIVLQADYSAQEVRLVLKQGIPAAVPVAPTLTTVEGNIYEIPLANIAVANGFVTIGSGNITDRRKYLWASGIQHHGTMSAGNLLVAESSLSLAKLPVPDDLAVLVGDTAKTEKMRFVSNRPHIIGGNGATNIGSNAAGTVIPLTSPAIANPNSWISSIASNQFFLTAGTYEISAFILFENNSGIANNVLPWIHNATTTAVVAQGVTAIFSGTSLVPCLAVIPPQTLVSNGTDAFELRGMSSGGLQIRTANGTLTPSASGGYASVTRMILIRKLKI